MSGRLRVGVVGVGSVGSMALWRLARMGVQASGFDLYAPGHDRGAAGGESRIFRLAYREGRDYVPLLKAARDLWHELEADTRTRLLTPCGALTIGERSDPEVQEVLACLEEYELAGEVLDAPSARARYPQHTLAEDELVVLDRDAGVLRPEVGVHAAALLAEQLGAELHRYTPVEEIEPTSQGVRVAVRGGRAFQFDRVLLAPGPWASRLGLLRDVGIQAREIVMFWVRAREPREYLADRFPVAIRMGHLPFSCLPSLDGLTVKISLHGYERPQVDDPESLRRSVDHHLVNLLEEVIREKLPGLYGEPLRIGTYADGFTEDGHGVVGDVGPDPRIIALSGFSGHGFKLAPVLGEIGAQLATEGKSSLLIERLQPGRLLTRKTRTPTGRETGAA